MFQTDLFKNKIVLVTGGGSWIGFAIAKQLLQLSATVIITSRKEERLKMKNDRLDAQIANKKKMKSILNAEQYAKWEKKQGKRNHMKRTKGKRDGKPKQE